MTLKVCLSATNTLMYPQGGHLWVFINWALGLRSCGCEVTWLDVVPTTLQLDQLVAKYEHLRKTLHPFGLDANLVVDFLSSEDLTDRLQESVSPASKALDLSIFLWTFATICPTGCLQIFAERL